MSMEIYYARLTRGRMRSIELVGRERMEVAQQLSIWGEGCDDDVSDVTDKIGVLVSFYTFTEHKCC